MARFSVPVASRTQTQQVFFMRAIETRYRGYRFRSRLEARWAVFFSALGLTWEYEPEGFVLPDGVWYLPDFRVYTPQGKVCWYEVKPGSVCYDEKFDTFFHDVVAKDYFDAGRALHAWCEIEAGVEALYKLKDEIGFTALFPRGGLLNGDPLDKMSGCVLCPRCGVVTDGIVSDTVICESCETEACQGFIENLSIEYDDGVLGTSYVFYNDQERAKRIGIADPSWNAFKDFRARVLRAARYSRAARFEHGQTPA